MCGDFKQNGKNKNKIFEDCIRLFFKAVINKKKKNYYKLIKELKKKPIK